LNSSLRGLWLSPSSFLFTNTSILSAQQIGRFTINEISKTIRPGFSPCSYQHDKQRQSTINLKSQHSARYELFLPALYYCSASFPEFVLPSLIQNAMIPNAKPHRTGRKRLFRTRQSYPAEQSSKPQQMHYFGLWQSNWPHHCSYNHNLQLFSWLHCLSSHIIMSAIIGLLVSNA
jgi:hypothetical protein